MLLKDFIKQTILAVIEGSNVQSETNIDMAIPQEIEFELTIFEEEGEILASHDDLMKFTHLLPKVRIKISV